MKDTVSNKLLRTLGMILAANQAHRTITIREIAKAERININAAYSRIKLLQRHGLIQRQSNLGGTMRAAFTLLPV